MSKIQHGANLYDISKFYNIPIDDIKDFSSNINPFGTSKKAIEYLKNHLNMVSIYPDPQYNGLKDSISKYSNCKEENILLGSGASMFIKSFIQILNPDKSMLIYPSYSEYEKELQKINSDIYKFYLKYEEDFKIDYKKITEVINENNIKLLLICNPNNPTGSILTREEMEYIIKNTSANIIVDETYIEFTDTSIYSCVSLTEKYSNLYVIRGTSKFFSTPGIRLGYGITSNEKVKDAFNNKHNIIWDINICADILGQIMFLDKEFIETTFNHMTTEMDYLYNELVKIPGLKPIKSYGNFILIKITNNKINSQELYDLFIKDLYVIRNCASFEGLDDTYFRVCILKSEENKKLIEKIKAVFNER